MKNQLKRQKKIAKKKKNRKDYEKHKNKNTTLPKKRKYKPNKAEIEARKRAEKNATMMTASGI